MVDERLSRRKVVAATAASSVLGLSGCIGGLGGDGGNGGNGNESDVEEVELGDGEKQMEFAGWGDGVERETVEGMLESFAQERDEIAINYQHVPDGYEDRLRTQFGAGEAPDTFYMGMEASGSFEEVLVDLQPELDQELLDDMDQSVMDAVSPREGLYYLPKDFQYNALVHNTEVLSNAGYDEFPEHWEEFRSMLEAVRDEGEVEYPVVNGDPYWLTFALIAANGGQVMNDDRSECVINSEENVETFEYIRGLREDDLLGLPDEVASDGDFAQLGEGDAAMVYGGGWILAELKSGYEDVNEVADIAAPPYPEGEEPGTLILCAGYSISTETEYHDESLDLVNYLMGDGIMPWLETGIALSIRESHRDQVDLYEEDERYQEWFEFSEFPRLTAQEYGPNTQEIINTINPQLEGFYQGEIDPQQTLETIEDEVNNILE
ncbi:extracellular solute-binding protein [Halomontanus rarus]|uniref:extracellular solute-binding protein n=1 Tax=Halomontanus rarus TaxID=3034020 RepID=UPI0023E86274|nr:extracellular solute-binding protein [Halovivax sp. TS33]